MVAFRYRAVAADGKSTSGVIAASDRRDALHRLSDRGLYPSELVNDADAGAASIAVAKSAPNTRASKSAGSGVKGQRPSSVERQVAPSESSATSETMAPSPSAKDTPKRTATNVDDPARLRVNRKQVTAFTRQMSTLLGATIAIPHALLGLAEQEENDDVRAVITSLAEDVRHGESLSEAMAKFPKLFTPLYVSMVEVGEESGRLDEVLAQLADLLEEQDELRSEVLGAVAYPVFVMAFGFITTIVLLTFIMPRLLGVLEGMESALPLPTRILLGISNALNQHWGVLLIVVAAGALLFRRWQRTERGALTWDRWRLSWPILGGLFKSAALSRFSRTLGTLQESGVSLLRSLEIVRDTVGNRYLSERIADVTEDTKSGDSLATPIRKLGLFPPTMVQMIAVGEDTGRLDEMLLRVAQIQGQRVRTQARSLISVLGPLLIVIVGAVVGFIVISLLLPIFQISQGMS